VQKRTSSILLRAMLFGSFTRTPLQLRLDKCGSVFLLLQLDH